MATENVKTFFESLSTDQAAADELASVKDADGFAKKVVEVAAARGVTLDKGDVEAHLAAQAKTGDQELNEQQLEQVAGGKGICITTGWNPTTHGCSFKAEPDGRNPGDIGTLGKR